jgi:peptide/nickel transport system substrate-binding protein
VKFHRRGLAIAGATMAVVTASGCGNASQPNKQEEAKAAQARAVDINPVPRDQLSDTGTLRWAVEQFSTQWNYNHLDGPEESTDLVVAALLPAAFTFDAQGVPTPDRDYVLSAEVTAREPRQVVTYKLNDRARWSDGTPITWKDYQAQVKALDGANSAYTAATTTGYDLVESVARGASDHEVVVTFSKPYAEWQRLFGRLYPAATNDNPAQFNTGWLGRIPVSAGPFKVEKIDKTAKTVTVVRDPAWWGAPAKLERIIFRAMEVDAAVNAFANGEVDVVDVGPTADSVKRASATPGAAVRRAAGADFRHFTLNGAAPLLSDVRVRRAVAHAIDREAIARSDLQDLDWPAAAVGQARPAGGPPAARRGRLDAGAGRDRAPEGRPRAGPALRGPRWDRDQQARG